MWRVTSLAVLLPYVLVNLWACGSGPDRPGALRNIELALAVSAVLYLVYADVLRIRELYADRDAISWGADPEQWAEPELPDTVRGLLLLLLGRLAGWLTALPRVHPTPDQRRRALGEPDSLAAASMVGESILSMLLTAAAVAVLGLLAERQLNAIGGPTEWPGPMTAVLVYPAVVVCVAAVLAGPSRRSTDAAIRYVPLRTGYRRRAALRVTFVFGTVLALLYAFDPVHLLSGDLPEKLRWPVTRPPVPPSTWATPRSPAMVELDRAWYRRGGLQAQAQLDTDLRALRHRIEASRPRHIDWGSFAPDCAAISRDVDVLDALGSFPFPDGQQPWSVLKGRSRTAAGVLCRHRYRTGEFQPLEAAALDIAAAESASRSVQTVLIHYLTSR
jgi:hypothetical protein